MKMKERNRRRICPSLQVGWRRYCMKLLSFSFSCDSSCIIFIFFHVILQTVFIFISLFCAVSNNFTTAKEISSARMSLRLVNVCCVNCLHFADQQNSGKCDCTNTVTTLTAVSCANCLPPYGLQYTDQIYQVCQVPKKPLGNYRSILQGGNGICFQDFGTMGWMNLLEEI